MKTFVRVAVVLLFCLFTNLYLQSQTHSTTANIQDNILLIAFDPSVSDAEIDALKRKYGVEDSEVESLRCVPRFYKWKLHSFNGLPNLLAVQDAERSRIKTYTDVNNPARLPDLTPSIHGPSEIFNYSSCTVKNRYQRIAGICADNQHKVYIIDSGLDGTITNGSFSLNPNHQAFFGNYLRRGSNGQYGFDIISPTFSPDALGHGTHVAGIVASIMQLNGITTRIVPVKTFDDQGNSNEWDICRAIDVSLCDGAKIINMSFGMENQDYGTISLNQKDFLGHLMDVAGQMYGTMFITAAGNDRANLNTNATRIVPAFYTSYLENVVTATSYCDNTRSLFANYSNPSFAKLHRKNYEVRIAADGENILSTWLDDNWAILSGTSMATPMVSAAFAIVGSKNETFNYKNVKDAILNRADKLRVRVSEWEDDRVLNIPRAYGACAVIPLELVNFNVQNWTNESALVTWETLSEKDLDYFEIEQSENVKDWQKVGRVQSKGNSTIKQVYDFIHNEANRLYPSVKTLYYRLKCVERTRQFRYSGVKSILSKTDDYQRFRVYPNPATEGGNWILGDKTQLGDCTVRLINVAGKVVLQRTQESNDTGYLSFTGLDVSSGLYILQVISTTGKSYQAHIFIQNK